jgi:hypothetical protein
VNLRSARVWITLVSLGAVSTLAIVDTRRASPGPISSVHANLGKLQGRSGCAECHGGWFSTMTDKCQSCHAPIQEQIQGRRGLHGRLDAAVAERCADCHAEHHGASFAIVNDKSFRNAGAPSTKGFKHDLVGFLMDGRHLEVGCVDCHQHANDKVLAEGTTRYLGLAQDCASCHEDPHEGRMQVACAACHGQTTWKDLHSLGHEKFLPLVGGHENLDCRTCHAQKDPHSLESMGIKEPLPQRDCAACHASPHSQAFSFGSARLAGMPLGSSCVTCHAAPHKSFREPGLTITAEQHATSGFALELPHDKVACAGCHAPGDEAFARRYPGRSKDTCTVCHADPHGGQFAAGPFAGQQCTACHDRERFEPSTFTVEKHALSSLPLTGKHADTACNDCHTRPDAGAGDPPRTFHGTPSDCGACHRDAHGGFFDEVVADVARESSPKHGQCELCHTTVAFAEIPPPGFDHERFTDFPVLGAHAQAECSSCHPPLPVADASGRTFGRVEEHFGAFKGCVTCHADPHGGQFDAADMPAEIEGRTDCARCHDETSFRSFPHGFEHKQWTGFDLVGAHKTECSACHQPLREPDAVGRTWKRAPGAGCAACHIDPHDEQFTGEGAKTCEQCHTDSQPSFLSFNHNRDSRFKLGEQHEDLACDQCHKPRADAQGFEVVQYRPLGTECVDCHGMHEDALIHRKRRR